MEFFKHNPISDDVKTILYKTDCTVTASNILQVVMTDFKEPIDAFVIETDVRSLLQFIFSAI